MSYSNPIAIYGPGGFGREVAWLLSSINLRKASREEIPYEVIAYVQDGASGNEAIRGIPVMPWDDFAGTCSVGPVAIAIAIGSPSVRRTLAQKCASQGLSFPSLIHPDVDRSKYIDIGEGAVICSGSILTVDIVIGRHVHINLDCTIGHDVRIADFTTVSPGVHISGNVHIGRSVYIGTGANIINGLPGKPLVIGEGAVIGAGACVTNEVEPHSLFAGVPAVLKKRYRA